jgi:anti-anti-sigma factor
MAENEHPSNAPQSAAPDDEARGEVVYRTPITPSTRLRTHTVVTQAIDGTCTAVVTLSGELCALTAPNLQQELEQLLLNGVVGLAVDLAELTFCTSHGLDALAAVDARLRESCGGTLELRNPTGIVERVVSIVRSSDPTFLLTVTSGTE